MNRVFIGGSYPGMRAAFTRQYYPGTIFASYASSAPVQAAVDMSFYFEPIWQGMRTLGWTNCTEDIHAAVLAMDALMENEAESFKLKERFLGPGAGNNTNAGFADALSAIFFLWQSYGVEGGREGLRSFCDHLSRDPATNKTSDAQGWAAVKGANFTIDRWSTWPLFPAVVNENLFTHCQDSVKPKNGTMAINCNLQERFPDASAISWTWQYCSQWYAHLIPGYSQKY
jgi:Serine carboxypeptidase S28